MESWIVLALIGVTCGVIATIVDVGADWATDLKFGYCNRGFWINRGVCCRDSSDMMGCPEWNDLSTEPHLAFLMYVGMAVSMATYSAWLTSVFSPYAAGSGIPEIKVILGGFMIQRFLGFWTLLIKVVGLVLSVGSGICIGKEGPFVHVCMCVGNLWCRQFGRYRRNEGRCREFLSCAAAAGVGVAFGAPIGGVLFSLEQVSTYFPPKTIWRSFFCAIVAVLTMQRLNRNAGSGKLVLFEVTYHHQWKWFELAPFSLLGILGGLLGAAFIRCHVLLLRLRARSPWLRDHPVAEAAAGSLVSAVVNHGSFLLRGSATGLLAALFAECRDAPAEVRRAMCAEGDYLETVQVLHLLHLLLLLLLLYLSRPSKA